MDILRIYTDGGCSGNQESVNFGGWGAILEMGEHQKELWGGEINTTNNRMELTAVIEAFNALKRDGLCIHVFSDSSYVTNCFREKWYEAWELQPLEKRRPKISRKSGFMERAPRSGPPA